MFVQDQLFRAVAPKPPVVVFVDFFLLQEVTPPEGSVVDQVTGDGGFVTITLS